MIRTKEILFEDGLNLIHSWCDANGVPRQTVSKMTGEPTFCVCAYYRDNKIFIWVHSCAAIGLAGRCWSYPGYVVDRTPYGVLAHETGHHVEKAHGSEGGIVAQQWRYQTWEPPITSYAPNHNEWFAEMFRLFLTNPDLLSKIRPKTYALMIERWPNRIETRPWQEVLADSERHIKAATNKIIQNGKL